MSKPIEFYELFDGDYFISFPSDGDDSGHGGYRGTSFVFRKVKTYDGHNNCFDVGRGIHNHMPAMMQVLRVSFVGK